MSQSQVVSFRASGHFLNWIEAQRLDSESVSQAAQRSIRSINRGKSLTDEPQTSQNLSQRGSLPRFIERIHNAFLRKSQARLHCLHYHLQQVIPVLCLQTCLHIWLKL